MKKIVKKALPQHGPILPSVVYRKPNVALISAASDVRDYSNRPEKREEEEDRKSIFRSYVKDAATGLKTYMMNVAYMIPRKFAQYVDTTFDPVSLSMSMRLRIENSPKMNEAYRILKGIRVEDRNDNGFTHLLPMYGVTRDQVVCVVHQKLVLIRAINGSCAHSYHIPLLEGWTKDDVLLSAKFELSQLCIWIAKERGGMRVPKQDSSNQEFVPLQAASAGPLDLITYHCAMLDRGRNPRANVPALEYQTDDSKHDTMGARDFEIVKDVPVMVSHGKSSYPFAGVPNAVVMTLDQGSLVTCLEFHPKEPNIFLVGTNSGKVAIWDIGSRDKLVQIDFKVSDLGACPESLQATLANDYAASITRVNWSPDGNLLGVASSKNVVQIYSYAGGDDLRKHLEFEAHVGSVNDLAFSYPNNKLSIVTCGDDHLIKVWDASTGAKQFELEGHDAPVSSVCTHFKNGVQYILSTAVNGEIKRWLYDTSGSKQDINAPGVSRIAFSDDGTRVFSSGTNKGEPFLVEWNEGEGGVRHNYKGLRKRVSEAVHFDTSKNRYIAACDEGEGGVRHNYKGFGKRVLEAVHFDTSKNRYIAACDEGSVMFWDMDRARVLTVVDLELDSPIPSFVRFNRSGMLIAVTTLHMIKILANPDGIKLLNASKDDPFTVSSSVSSDGTESAFGTSSTTLGATNSETHGISVGH